MPGMENRIKEQKLFIFADRLSTHTLRVLGQACYSFHNAPQVCSREPLEICLQVAP